MVLTLREGAEKYERSETEILVDGVHHSNHRNRLTC